MRPEVAEQQWAWGQTSLSNFVVRIFSTSSRRTGELAHDGFCRYGQLTRWAKAKIGLTNSRPCLPASFDNRPATAELLRGEDARCNLRDRCSRPVTLVLSWLRTGEDVTFIAGGEHLKEMHRRLLKLAAVPLSGSRVRLPPKARTVPRPGFPNEPVVIKPKL